MAEWVRHFATDDGVQECGGGITVRAVNGVQKWKLQIAPRADVDTGALGEVFACTAFPETPTDVARGTPTVFWIAPGEWWIAGGALDPATCRQRLAELLGQSTHALTDLSDGLALLELAGAQAPALLSATTSMAFDETDPAAGHYRLTRMHDSAVLVHRPATPSHYHLYVPRSIVRFLNDWLVERASDLTPDGVNP